MLNRRILRSKALQLAYAYHSGIKANYQLALEYVKEVYSPDLNSLELQDKDKLKEQEILAVNLFKKNESSEDKDINKTLKEAKKHFQELNKQDLKVYKKQLTKHTEKVYELYLSALLLLIKLADMVNVEAHDIAKNKPLAPEPDQDSLKLYHNKVIRKIDQTKDFHKECESHRINWNSDQEFIDNLYKEGLKTNDSYKKYLNKPLSKISWEDDKNICTLILSEVIFANKLADSTFEEMDISWFQNKAIVKSLVKFTFKNIKEDSKFEFAPLAKNWEEDKSFYENLFNFAVENDDKYESLIEESTKNWDKERITMMDKIIIKLALAELENFPSIPIKVTINEFIDLSKQYSTPKSKTFVNGVLDKLSKRLVEEGKIKKTGRGLIDN